MNKAKLLIVAIAAIVITFVMTQSSLSYYVSVGRADNVITSGDIQLKILEKTGDGSDFPSEGVVIVPGDIVSKQVMIENICAHPFYLRVKLVDGVDSTELSSEDCFGINVDTENWIFRDDGYYYYKDVVEPFATTVPVFTEVEIVGEEVDNTYIGKTLTLTVRAQAVQTENNEAENSWEAIGWPEG